MSIYYAQVTPKFISYSPHLMSSLLESPQNEGPGQQHHQLRGGRKGNNILRSAVCGVPILGF